MHYPSTTRSLPLGEAYKTRPDTVTASLLGDVQHGIISQMTIAMPYLASVSYCKTGGPLSMESEIAMQIQMHPLGIG